MKAAMQTRKFAYARIVKKFAYDFAHTPQIASIIAEKRSPEIERKHYPLLRCTYQKEDLIDDKPMLTEPCIIILQSYNSCRKF
ncbi:hypothetical protein T4D_16367 [Trichinella pseudospiralis]|uniref:Uncharacterized protein n=1 Tax=Trichinella pseudospiralis TaxID=6337 RepID=A0A0V1FR57_TRIPS|nr:hypothetical protein T4D_16367 [Trichinella pseudospiralis]